MSLQVAVLWIIVLAVTFIAGYVIGLFASRESGHWDVRHKGFEEGCDSACREWEGDAIRRGVGRYEQYLTRDGMKTRFAWNAQQQPTSPKGYE
jgi:hypothetical protein